MRVLLLAESCNPDHTSVPLEGYKTCKAISEHVDEAIIVTAIRNKEAIERTGIGRGRCVYIDNERLSYATWKLNQWLRSGQDLSEAIRLALFFDFERKVWHRFKSDLDGKRFDIVHRITPASSAVPSPMSVWCTSKLTSKIPFVIGPINGGLPFPPQFRSTQIKGREWLRFIRGANRFLPYVSSTYKNASAILASFEHTIQTLPFRPMERIFDVPTVGVDSSLFSGVERAKGDGRCTFIFVGRLVPFKCPHVNILAFAASEKLRSHRLIIVGDGPERPMLEKLIKEYHLEASVRLFGQLSHARVAEEMRAADVFAFPSIRDSGAGVIPEAMMSGLPTIAVNYGPGQHLLTDECGIRVQLGTMKDHVERFRTAMESLADDPQLRHAMGISASHRASSILDWNVKAKRIRQVYDWVLGVRKDKPDFYSELAP
jgi:glycosyltransferase involved in cell wall biosynthesis